MKNEDLTRTWCIVLKTIIASSNMLLGFFEKYFRGFKSFQEISTKAKWFFLVELIENLKKVLHMYMKLGKF